MAGPLEQFTVKPIIPIEINGYDISFTNASLFMCLTVLTIVAVFAFCLRKRTIVPTLSQSVPELLYEFIRGIMQGSAGKDGLKYFSFIFTIFLFVAFGNIFGLVPYGFTFTSQLATVGCLSILALLFNIAIGIRTKKWGYLRTFLPKGIPFVLAPLVVPIEAISLLSKPFSLTVRLVANMTVGHIMLKILAGFVVALGIAGVVPLVFDALIIMFEIFVALLQAFIYTVLSCIYLSDAIHSH
jgi:F-type H+-transporting ATPase subunit a